MYRTAARLAGQGEDRGRRQRRGAAFAESACAAWKDSFEYGLLEHTAPRERLAIWTAL